MIGSRFLLVCLLGIIFGICLIVKAIPVSNNAVPISYLGNMTNEDGEEEENSTDAHGLHKDLYVVKAVVYEIGILTESNNTNSSEDDNYSHERVDLTFFDAHKNGSHLDLGNIPLPVQTNVSGQVLTGIAPVHVGSITNATNLFGTLPLTGTIVNISHSDTSFVTLSHTPKIGANGSTIINAQDLAKLPGINGSQAILVPNDKSVPY